MFGTVPNLLIIITRVGGPWVDQPVPALRVGHKGPIQLHHCTGICLEPSKIYLLSFLV